MGLPMAVITKVYYACLVFCGASLFVPVIATKIARKIKEGR